MLRDGKAAVYRKHPFTIILRPANGQAALPGFGSDGGVVPNLETTGLLRLKIDPGSRTTGLAVVNDGRAGNRMGRGTQAPGAGNQKGSGPPAGDAAGPPQPQDPLPPGPVGPTGGGATVIGVGAILSRGSLSAVPAERRGRTEKELEHRPPARIAPSLMSRVFNVMTWVRRLCAAFPIGAISVEVARFDLQKMENGEIAGVEYQQGTLAGYEVREYLLEHWDRKCAYCGKSNLPLEIEHVIPRSRGGTSRISNLTLACHSCNEKKGNKGEDEFPIPDRVKRHLRAPLKDATMMNVTRYELLRRLRETGLPVETGTGGRTKFNRTRAGLGKSHWADAACVGESTPERWRIGTGQVQEIRSRSYARRGRRQVCLVCPVGFSGFPNPCGHKNRGPKVFCKGHSGKPKAGVRFFRYQTSDFVQVKKTKGKWEGVYQGRISVRSSGNFVFSPRNKEKQPPSFHARDIEKLIYRCGSYEYSARELVAQASSAPA